MEIEVGRLFGLPAHAFFVHVPIVLTPIAAVGSVFVALSARWRQRIGVIVLASVIVLAVVTQLAIGSGEALEEAVRKTPLVQEHASQSDVLEPVILVLLLCVIAVLWLHRRPASAARWWPRRFVQRRLGLASAAVAAATIIASVAAVGLVIRAGHSGSRAVWKDNPQLVRPLP